MTAKNKYYLTYGDDTYTKDSQKDLTAFIQHVMDSTIEESADGRYFIRGETRGEVPPLPPSIGEHPPSRGVSDGNTSSRGDAPLRGEVPPLPPSSVVSDGNTSSRGVRGEFPPSDVDILMQILGCSQDRAHDVLASANYNLEAAIQNYSGNVLDPNKQLTNYIKDVILQNLKESDGRGNYYVVDSRIDNIDDRNHISRYIQDIVASNLHTLRDKEFYVWERPDQTHLMLTESELAKYVQVDQQNYRDDLYYIDYMDSSSSSLQKESNSPLQKGVLDEVEEKDIEDFSYQERHVTFEDESLEFDMEKESYPFNNDTVSLFNDFHKANIASSLEDLGIGRTPTMGLWYVLPCPSSSSRITAKPISKEKDLGWDEDFASGRCGGSYPDARRDSVYAAIHSRIEGHLSGEDELSNGQLAILFDIIKNKDDFDSDDYLITNEHLRDQMMKLDRMNTMILDTLAESYLKYGEGDFADLTSEATKKILSDAALMLVNNDLFTFTNQEIHEYEPPEDIFTDYRSFILSTINGVNAAALLHQSNQGITDENELLHESHEILNNRKKLAEYVEKHYGGFNSLLFEVDFALENTLTIKAEYEIYIRRHGVPNKGLFDAEKLALILHELNGGQNGDGQPNDGEPDDGDPSHDGHICP